VIGRQQMVIDSLIMTPRAVVWCTRSMFRHNDGNCCEFLALAMGDWNAIYLHLLALNRKLFSSACTPGLVAFLLHWCDWLSGKKSVRRSFLTMSVWLLKSTPPPETRYKKFSRGGDFVQGVPPQSIPLKYSLGGRPLGRGTMGMAGPGNGRPWEWGTLGMADPNHPIRSAISLRLQWWLL